MFSVSDTYTTLGAIKMLQYLTLRVIFGSDLYIVSTYIIITQ